MPNLHTTLVDCAKTEGFPLSGTVDLDLAFADHQSPVSIGQHIGHYDRWLQAGYEGSMEYLRRGRDRRANPRLVFPEAQSILCVALPYRKQVAGSVASSEGPRYARYLEGADYHQVISAKLERVMLQAQAQIPDLKWKVCVDTSAVLERAWASLAGLGWIGKNTLLIHPKLGSYFFIGSVLINQATGKSPAPMASLCGNCRRCLDSCPTQALNENRKLDSNQCISYWTLEKRGPLNISDEKKQKLGRWIAGCDICQEACPFNLKPVRADLLAEETLPAGAIDLKTWESLLEETESEYRLRIKNSALNRVKPRQFSRNLAIALSNAVPTLQLNPDKKLLSLVEMRLTSEEDPTAKIEWAQCLEKLSNSLPNTLNGV